MYTEEIITLLTNRIGFGTPQEEGFSIELDEANSVGVSGRKFSSFHSLVTVENILAGIENADPDDNEFNLILSDYRKAAVLEILPLIMDKNPDYLTATNYDNTITDNVILFDDAIGYKVAMMVLEMFISTNRSNIVERNAKLAISNLKLEIEGYRNENGALVASGLVQKFNQAVKLATKKIFPFVIEVKNGNVW